MCGEKPALAAMVSYLVGSPPHVRGKEGRVRLFQRLGGITPAYAGKSAQKVLSFWPIRGSPPHMRGKVIVDLVLTERHRITPAYAGKSSGRTAKYGTSGDHPRMCGEKYGRDAKALLKEGSPPHVRGKVTQIVHIQH